MNVLHAVDGIAIATMAFHGSRLNELPRSQIALSFVSCCLWIQTGGEEKATRKGGRSFSKRSDAK